MKFISPLILGLLALATGCATNHEKINFSDEADVRAAVASSEVVPPVSMKLEKTDELKIEQVVFGHLLEGHFWNARDYSAIFIQSDDSQVDVMMKKYPNSVPPVKESDHALIEANHTPMDKDTGKPAVVLSADVNEPNADGSVNAVGRWYAGDVVTGSRMFHLTKLNDIWVIVDVK